MIGGLLFWSRVCWFCDWSNSILGVCGADGLIFDGGTSGDVMGSVLGDGCVIEFSELTGFVVVARNMVLVVFAHAGIHIYIPQNNSQL